MGCSWIFPCERGLTNYPTRFFFNTYETWDGPPNIGDTQCMIIGDMGVHLKGTSHSLTFTRKGFQLILSDRIQFF